jgi:hypothetical protein
VYLWLTEWHIHPQVGGFEVSWLPLCIRVGDLVVGVIGDACVYILCLFLILIFDCDQNTSSSSTISQYLSRLPTQYPHPDLHLQPFIFARQLIRNKDDGTNFYYNANLTAKDGSVLVNLEQIIPFISTTTCPTGSSGSIDITFTSAGEYNIAAGSWPTTFQLMTSGTAYCGTDDGRTFYSVASVDFASATNSVSLGVTLTTIGDAVEVVQALWGTAGTPPPAHKEKRDSSSSSTVITLNPNSFAAFFDFLSTVNAEDFPGIGTSPIQVLNLSVIMVDSTNFHYKV